MVLPQLICSISVLGASLLPPELMELALVAAHTTLSVASAPCLTDNRGRGGTIWHPCGSGLMALCSQHGGLHVSNSQQPAPVHHREWLRVCRPSGTSCDQHDTFRRCTCVSQRLCACLQVLSHPTGPA